MLSGPVCEIDEYVMQGHQDAPRTALHGPYFEVVKYSVQYLCARPVSSRFCRTGRVSNGALARRRTRLLCDANLGFGCNVGYAREDKQELMMSHARLTLRC